MSTCVVCDGPLSGRQTRFCSRPCTQKGYSQRHLRERRAYYLELKAKGYFQARCPGCGQFKSVGAKRCAKCFGNAKGAHKPPAKCDTCGVPVYRKSTRCRICAARLRRTRTTNDQPMYHRSLREKPTVCSYCLVPLRKTQWHGKAIFRCPECGLELREVPPYFNDKEAA